MYRLFSCLFVFGWVAVTQLACISKHVVGTELKTEERTSRIYKSDYSAEIGLVPSRTLEKKRASGLGVEVRHLGPLNEKIADCLRSAGAPAYDASNPRHLFLFELSNDSEELREFTPYMGFDHRKLQKKASLSMLGSGDDLCSVVLDFLPINQISVVPGEKQVLQCSAAQGGNAASFVNNDNAGGPRSYELYPEQKRRGILIATQPKNSDAVINQPDIVAGKFVLYVHPTSTGLKSKVLTIPYSFSRTQTETRIPYDRKTTRGYTVEEIQEYFHLLMILPVASGEPYFQRVEGTEVDMGSRDVQVGR